MLFLPQNELVAQAWLRDIEGVPDNAVGATLPADNSTWAASGFVQYMVVGGSPGVYLPVSNPVMQIDCWATNAGGSSKPPWGKANYLASLIKNAGYGGVNSPSAPAREVVLPAEYLNARVMAAYALTEPRRLPNDEARYARYQFDMQFRWVVVSE